VTRLEEKREGTGRIDRESGNRDINNEMQTVGSALYVFLL
jgi:hypothetical protein